MKIPAKIKLLGHDISVVRKKTKKKKKVLGYCNVDRNEIYLKKDLLGDRLNEVFFHESIHAVDSILELKLTERQVNNLAVGVYDLLKNNEMLRL